MELYGLLVGLRIGRVERSKKSQISIAVSAKMGWGVGEEESGEGRIFITGEEDGMVGMEMNVTGG